MHELMETGSTNRRWQLLTTVSGLVLLASLPLATNAAARNTDADRPTVWIEIGGELQRLSGAAEPFAPDFTRITPMPGPYSPVSPLQAQRSARYSIGGEAKFTVAPSSSDWAFTAAIRYGRANRSPLIHQQTDIATHGTLNLFGQELVFDYADHVFADTKVKNSSSQVFVDFQVGKDIGIGLFGTKGESTLNFGVRFGQIVSRSEVEIHARPDFEWLFYPIAGYLLPINFKHHDFVGIASNQRSFAGLGPSFSWDNSAALLRDSEDATLNVDWGINGALLFGRQKARGSSHVSAHAYERKYHPSENYGYVEFYPSKNKAHDRNRFVVVPNIGAFAGVSYQFPNAKFSLGYRVDYFFGAMDGGVETRKSADRAFYGPFVKVAVGL